jgi:hypothetical protein
VDFEHQSFRNSVNTSCSVLVFGYFRKLYNNLNIRDYMVVYFRKKCKSSKFIIFKKLFVFILYLSILLHVPVFCFSFAVSPAKCRRDGKNETEFNLNFQYFLHVLNLSDLLKFQNKSTQITVDSVHACHFLSVCPFAKHSLESMLYIRLIM